MIGPSCRLTGPSGLRYHQKTEWVHAYAGGRQIAGQSLRHVPVEDFEQKLRIAVRQVLELVCQWWSPRLAQMLANMQVEVYPDV